MLGQTEVWCVRVVLMWKEEEVWSEVGWVLFVFMFWLVFGSGKVKMVVIDV